MNNECDFEERKKERKKEGLSCPYPYPYPYPWLSEPYAQTLTQLDWSITSTPYIIHSFIQNPIDDIEYSTPLHSSLV